MKTRSMKRGWWTWGVVASALALQLACEDPKITPEQAAPFVQGWSEQFGPTLKERASMGATSEALKKSLLQAREQETKRLAKEPPYARLVEELYQEREYKPAFVKAGDLTPNGELVLGNLEQVADDGLSPLPYQVGDVREKLAALSKLKEELASLKDFAPGDAERAFVTSQVTSKKPEEFTLEASSYEAMNDAVLASDAGAALKGQLARYEEIGAKMAVTQAEIEQVLALGLARYAREMRYFHHPDAFVHPRQDDFYNDPETRASRPTEAQAAYQAGLVWRHAIFTSQDVIKKHGEALLEEKIQQTVRAALAAKDEQVGATIAELSPGPQYDGLKAEYIRYRNIAEAGGWEELPEQKSLKQGSKGAIVEKLKKRLQIEGYFPKDKELTQLFDADLKDAIIAYQSTHQMEADGKPGKTFWRSLNVSAEKRAAQLLTTMKKWRESNVQHHDQDTYVLVNLPDFTAEIWKDQARAMRMRVVIGNNDRVKDEESGEMQNPNRTPTLSAYIDRVIYNPYWNVTPRIREDEILVDVRKDLEAVYQAKVDKLLASKNTAPLAPTQGVSPSPAGLQGGAAVVANTAAPTAMPAATAPKPYGKTGEGWRLDIPAFQQAYVRSHGAEADLATLFPYLVPDTGLVDVSVTKPDNIPPWYAKNGYEVMHAGKSWEFVRQLNGDDNSLGRVKIIFPNLHDVYLHDTPAKALFNKEIRAYSHGCMRMHQPLDFAKWLLENDGTYDSAKIKKYLSDKTYMPIFLQRQVPVHVVYFTSRVDDEGRANFLIDIYDRE